MNGDRRHLILQAAERLLQHYGPGKTTVADIAREAGLGVGTVYLEFSSKDAILIQLARDRHTQLSGFLEKTATSPAPAGERIRAFMEGRTRFYREETRRGTHAADLMHCFCPAVEEVHRAYEKEERQLLADLLRQGREEGEPVGNEVEVLARALQEAYRGLTPPRVFRLKEEEVRSLLVGLSGLIFAGWRSCGSSKGGDPEEIGQAP